jgi:Family of unknown function (DUF6011)
MNAVARDTTFDDMDTDLSHVETRTHKQVEEKPCTTCLGTGQKKYGYRNIQYFPCTVCKGTGKVTHERLNRRAGAKKARATREENLAKKKAEFKAAHPAVVAWIEDRAMKNVKLAISMAENINLYGSLKENGIALIERLIKEDAERAEARKAEQMKSAVDVSAGAEKILTALRQAVEKGLKRPSLRTQVCTFSLAPASGRNAGCVYVVERAARGSGDENKYLGKIDPTGMFMASRDCTPEQKAAVALVAADPLAAAVLYGRMTGQCSCCGKELTNQKSIDLGIGPICLAKYF